MKNRYFCRRARSFRENNLKSLEKRDMPRKLGNPGKTETSVKLVYSCFEGIVIFALIFLEFRLIRSS